MCDPHNFDQLHSIRIRSLLILTFVSLVSQKLSKNLSKALLDYREGNYSTEMNPVALL